LERSNVPLVELIKEAFAIRNQFLSGSHDSIEAMSRRLGMNKGLAPASGPFCAMPIASLGPFPAENTGTQENSQTFHGFLKGEPVLTLSHERGEIPAPGLCATR
jgi:hypothetical protein